MRLTNIRPVVACAMTILAMSLLSTLSTGIFAQSAPTKNPNSRDRAMSAAGALAARVRKALETAGVRPLALPGDPDSDECINTSEECEEGFEEGPPSTQSETSIAVDRTGRHVVVGFNDFRGFSLNPVSLSGFMYSDDGGKTFVDGGQLPSPGNDVIGTTRLPQIFGDPDVKYLGACNFVYSSIMVKKLTDTSTAQTMSIHRSTDCGHTWAGPFEVTSATIQGNSADKEFIDVDPDTGRLILSWTNFAPGATQISTTYSDDILTGNPPTWSPRQIVAATNVDGQGSIPRFAGNGSPNAYVVWSRFPSGLNNNIGFARSTDGGQTWSAPVNLAPDFFTMDQVLGNDRVHNFPSMAVDHSRRRSSGNIYVVYAGNDNHDGADIYFQRSVDQGLTFSAPVALNRRPGRDRAQWFPWVTVDEHTGRVFVFYYDQGVAKSGDLTQVAYTFSDDGGETWRKPRALTDKPFRAGWGNDTGQPNLGDYNQGVARGGELFAVWAGTSPVGFTDGQPGTGLTVPNVFFKRTHGFSHDKYSKEDLEDLTADSTEDSKSIGPGASAGLRADLMAHAGGWRFRDWRFHKRPVTTTLLEENFDDLTPGALPADWIANHGGGANVVPWVTSDSFCGSGSNAAFHQNANDGLPPGPGVNSSPVRIERLFSPPVTVPADADLVTLDFDVCYDTEDDPNFNILAYDGLVLRIADMTPGNTLRSVLVEAFAKEFITGDFQHYPKHFPRNGNNAYFQDMSAWAGFSNGFKHVHLELPGMAGTTAQLRFEYTQDSSATCADVRPGNSCGVAIDNIKMKSIKYVHSRTAH